jgi:serine/threonine protein kinase/tetratricopeptide (TPR) repeat protein
MIERTISHFRILEKLGAGGMGVVYKALDTRLDRPVALKFLPDSLVRDAQALERFRREAHAASALNHPGICTIYDLGEENKLPFIAMEFIDGETLRQHLHGQPLAIEEILHLGIQIADALDVAHSSGIIHRDIKPSNVFVTKRGQAKVLDFGLAKLVAKDVLGANPEETSSKATQDSLSIVGVISGTPAYMSPEHVRGDDLDARTDIFALGLLLYEMATGKQAFGGKTGGAIIEAILTRNPAPVQSVNSQIPAQLEAIVGKCMEKDREKRYQTAAEVRTDLQQLKRVSESGQVTVTSLVVPRGEGRAGRKAIAAGGIALIAVLAIAGWFYNTRRAHALNQTDTLVLADFANKTGDPIFDDTLRQGLAAQLQQSPFLSLVSDQRIQQTLRLMGKPADTKLSAAIAGDLCLRAGSKAYLSGSIASMGSEYVIGVSAVNCQTGDYLAQEQVTAEGKENVLKALGSAATALRGKLGESLKTVHNLDTPIEQATTPSLEALQAYSLGRKTMQGKGDFPDAVPLFQRAIQLDPNFAMAYAFLGTTYHNLGEKNLAADNTRKAYGLRSRVSEWEKFYIESHYHHFATGDLEKARQAYELWAQIYPREQVPVINLGIIYQTLGQFDKSLAEVQQALTMGPPDSLNYGNLVVAQIHLNHLGEAWKSADEAQARGMDSADLRLYLYQIAFLKHDAPGMTQEALWSMGKPGIENLMLAQEAGTAAYSGKLGAARELSQQAETSASHAGEKEMAAGCAATAALWEALYGNGLEAKAHASLTLTQSRGRDAQYVAALALALVGDSARARGLSDELEKRFPEDTIVRFNYLPTLRAQLALNEPGGAAKAIESLAAAAPYELGVPGSSTFWTNLYPVYVRGEAYLAAHEGAQAAAEFQKVLDWPGVVVNEPIGALAELGLARAYSVSGEAGKARGAYEAFFTLWKDADGNIPALKEAKAEYGRLK